MSGLARLHIALDLEGPILTRATKPGDPGLDSPVARDAAGRPLLAYSLIQGHLRHAWEEIGPALGLQPARRAELLGQPSADGEWSPRPGRLLWSDFLAGHPGGQGVATSLRLDPDRRAAGDGALYHLEVPFAPGERVRFEGRVRFWARDGAEAAEIAGQIERGLSWLTFLGSGRTVGFGRLLGVEVHLETQDLPKPTPARVLESSPVAVPLSRPGRGDRGEGHSVDRDEEANLQHATHLPLELRFRDPFCLAARPEGVVGGDGGNLFLSSPILPGGAIKGTLARQLQALFGLPAGTPLGDNLPEPFAALGRAFDRLRVTHAFPALEGGARPAMLPESLAQAGGRLWDVALCPGPVLIGGQAPAFAVDWKEKSRAAHAAAFGWPEIDTELRLRTAIDRTSRRGADQQLFAYEMVRPEGRVWHAALDLAEVEPGERAAVEAQLRAVLALGLQGLGKTDAEARVEIGEAGAAPAPGPSLEDAGGAPVWVMTLQTPALLADPDCLQEGANDRDLHAAYATAWSDLSGGALRLVRAFTRERLAGGYLTERFRRSWRETAYRPYLLTEAGSVFVLAPAREDLDESHGASLLARWQANGLPLPAWARERYGESWRTCPFTRFDGYGEIAVNLESHTRNRPHDVEELPWQDPSAG